MYLNQTIVWGNLGDDAISKKQGERYVLTFRLAATKRFTNSAGESKERTEWFEVEFWCQSFNQQQFLVANLRKGTSALVQGEMRFEKYESDGVRRFSARLVADKVEPMGKINLVKPQATATPASEPAQAPPVATSAPHVAAAVAAPLPHPATPFTPPIDLKIPDGQCRARVIAGDGKTSAELVADVQLIESYVRSGQAVILTYGMPALKPAAALPADAPPAAGEVHTATRPPLPSFEIYDSSTTAGERERPF
jgi:single-strand DNA-binding protein